MTINFENQSTLAKLLAKENITVTTGNMKTAYFDVKNRTLGLPNWKNRGKDVYDMLTGHEVGHALYTPADAIERLKERCGSIPFDVCNIVEDIRIERLIQKTYPGLPRVFKSAYDKLAEDDFFGIKNEDVHSLKFLDRLNLRGKIGSIVDVPLDADEEVIYQKCLSAESFDDVLDVCNDIKEFINSKKEEPQPQPDQGQDESSGEEEEDETPPQPDTESDGDEGNESDDGEEAEAADSTDDGDDDEDVDSDASQNVTSDNEDSDNSDSENDGEASASSAPEIPEELFSDTLENFEKSVSDEVETPKKLGVMSMLAPRKDYIYDQITDYKTLSASRKKRIVRDNINLSEDYITQAYKEFKKTTNTKVGVLVREFEQRKAAFQYSRATQARTGKLDVNKLHNYKLTDELFLSQTKLADAKSHGMVFLVDYSGSMSSVLPDVLKQTLNLVTFCKKVGIPFVVYSFTSAFRHKKTSKMTATINEVYLNDTLIVEHISSELSKADYEEAFFHLWVRAYGRMNLSSYDELGGTPLDSVLTAMPTVIQDFINRHRVQKLNFVTLTDGDSSYVSTSHDHSDYVAGRKYQVKLAGKVHQLSQNDCTGQLMEIIRGMPEVTTIGFYLPGHKQDIKRRIERSVSYSHDHRTKVNKLRKEHTKAGFLNMEKRGYDAYYLLDSDVSINDSDFVMAKPIEVDISKDKRSQTRLAKEFGKHHSAARKNRVLLTNIATQIA